MQKIFQRRLGKLRYSKALAASLLCMLVVLALDSRQALALSITNVLVSNITSTTATISWTTDELSDSEVYFVPSATVGQEPVNVTGQASTLAHSANLTGLLPNTNYLYAVSSAKDTNVVWSDDGYFTTLATTTSNPPPASGASPGKPGVAPNPGSGLQYDALAVASQGAANSNSPYKTGTLGLEGSTIYFLMAKDMVKIPFTNFPAFQGLGYKLADTKSLDLSKYRTSVNYFLTSASQEHPWGSCLKDADGTVYYAHSSGMIGIPNMEILNSVGCQVVDMNAKDRAVLGSSGSVEVLKLLDPRLL